MRYIITLISLLCLITGISAQTNYQRIAIDYSQENLHTIASLGIPVEEGYLDRENMTYIMEISETAIKKINAAGLKYSILINNVASYYKNRLNDVETLTPEEKTQREKLNREWPIPEGFEYGSMGGYLTLDEVMAHLDNMHTLYPDLISARQPASEITTVEGRNIYYVKISDNPDINEDENEVLYTALHHAREPGGLMHVIYYMYYLLENYSTDPNIKNIIDNTEMYFIPVVNPDGYQYNYTTDPNGGGQWRKNRANNGDGTYGVDLNRNYGYQWGYDNSGSSPYTSEETYRGTAPFSENESQVIKEFCEAHEFKIALNYHTYSNLLLFAWGYDEILTPDNDRMMEFGRLMTMENNYTYGPCATTIYPSNGGSDDWMYGEQDTKEKILAFTPEVGSSSDGFWPAQSRIIPLCQENMLQSIYAAQLAGDYIDVVDQSNTIVETKNSYFPFVVSKLGLGSEPEYSLSIEPISPEFATVGAAKIYTPEMLSSPLLDSISFTLSETIPNGTPLLFRYVLSNGITTQNFEVEKIYGQTTSLFFDSCNDMNNWESSSWNFTDNAYVSAPGSITDSPEGNYSNSVNSYVLLETELDLSQAIYASASFWAKWDIEAGYDYVEFLASINGGTSWAPIEGKYTHPGGNNQHPGMPLYDGIQNTWVLEQANLNPFIGEQVQLRFKLHSDTYENGDGFYFDDLEVKIIGNTVGTNTFHQEEAAVLVWPQPTRTNLTFSLQGDNTIQCIQLYSLQGNKIMEAVDKNQQRITLNVNHLAPGMYLYCLTNDEGKKHNGKFMIQ